LGRLIEDFSVKAVILAGGTGSRLWPASRESRPKQFLPLVGERSLLQQTYDRLHSFVPASDLYVCTAAAYQGLVSEQLPELSRENILVEPTQRGTGPAIGWIATRFHALFGETTVATIAADHVVRRPEEFTRALSLAARAVTDCPTGIVTIGIRPTGPDPGYGYIQMGGLFRAEQAGSLYTVKQFVEKPDRARAQQFLAEGRYLWNASYFVWSSGRMLALLEQLLPEVAGPLAGVRDSLGTDAEEEALRAAYAAMPKVTIDRGVMERADEVLVAPAEMGWSDVGSWERLHEALPAGEGGVVAVGRHVGLDDSDCLFYSGGRLVATIGLKDVIVVETADAVLVCDRGRSQDLKQLMDRLRQAGCEEYLA
jgi:mannose-1-phosphate guanylyltransferase